MNPLPQFETLTMTDSLIDEVIANMSTAFQAAGVEESTLQQLKQKWSSKVQTILQGIPTDQVPNEDAETPDDTTKKDEKEKPVPVQQAPDTVTNNSPTPIPVTGANPLGIKWKFQETELRPLLVRRRNKAVGTALQLDGDMPTIGEETSEEGETPDDTTKKDEKEKPVPVQQAPDTVTNISPTPIPVIGANPLGIKWKFQETELRPLLVRRRNKAVGTALQLDGDMPTLGEETSEEGDDEVSEPEVRGDDESLNSGDDLTGEDAAGDDVFESDNVITCQYSRISHKQDKWCIELCDGVMHLNGKDYAFKQMYGEADW